MLNLVYFQNEFGDLVSLSWSSLLALDLDYTPVFSVMTIIHSERLWSAVREQPPESQGRES